MIDERFVPAAFAGLPEDGPAVKSLCRELGAEVAAELHRAVEGAFRRVADRLRALGHDLPEQAPDFDPEFNSWHYSYRPGGSADRERYHLRLFLDTQVCVFFPGRQWPTGGGSGAGPPEGEGPG